jgi:tRNA threonylcarbamoyl adenosine modification protein YeaZ
VALLKGKKSIIEKSWNSKRDEAEKILPSIVTMLKKVKKRWEDVKEIMVITGPGPFTGLRVGVTIANTIAWTENLPLKTFTVFEYLHARVPTKLQEKTAILVKGGGEYSPKSFHSFWMSLKNFAEERGEEEE